MKKCLSLLIAIVFVILSTLNFVSCNKTEPREVTCEEILDAYESAGYTIRYHNHNDPIYYESNIYCDIAIDDPIYPERNYIYITRCNTEEDAENMVDEQRFNPILWFTFGIYGEWRWLKNGNFGDVYYSTFDSKMIEPLRSLVE